MIIITILSLIALAVVALLTSYNKRLKKEEAEHKAWLAEARAEKAARKSHYYKACLPVDSPYNV